MSSRGHDRVLPLVILGTGLAWEHLHWPAIEHHGPERFQVIGLTNRTSEKAQKWSRPLAQWQGFEPEICPTVDAALDLGAREGAGIVSILPFNLNKPVIGSWAKRPSRGLMVEKPLAGSLADGQRAIAAAGAVASKVMVAENFLFRQGTLRIASLLGDHSLGDLVRVHSIRQRFMAPSNPYSSTAWRTDGSHFGGYLLDSAVHPMSMLVHFFGSLKFSHGWQAAPLGLSNGAPDCLEASFVTDHGVPIHCFFDNGAHVERSYLELVGTQSTLVLDGDLLSLHQNGQQLWSESLADDGGYAAQYAAFHGLAIDDIANGSSLSMAYSTMEPLVEALEQSPWRILAD